MQLPVVMPQLGLTMTEGTVAEWLKKPGDEVRKGEVLFIVSTDKADLEVESSAEGTLTQVLIESGRTVPVGTVIAYLEKPGEEAVTGSAPVTAPTLLALPKEPHEDVNGPPREHGQAMTTQESPREKIPASPRARRLAGQLGVDLSMIKGSGAGGRIEEEDVRKSGEATRAQGTTLGVRHRKLIAERMVESVRTIPHFSVSLEIDAEGLLSLYESLKAPVEKAIGVKPTLTDLLLKGLGLALDESPAMNAVWDEERSAGRNTVDLGLAIATERGVVAPVIHHVERLEVAGVAARRRELVQKAREGRLALSDLEGGVGTLSNLGSYRVDHFQALISPGQTFVLAVGRIKGRPWVEDTTLTVRPTVNLNLSVDHRVADGAVAALFLGKVAEIIENPSRILQNPKQPG